ncbi:MAG: glycosyltransferase [Candidatus Staskawiczbacteria bacterium]|nr:glycosyltransferase [Candidatus Staskawiczbacteria bacterium]
MQEKSKGFGKIHVAFFLPSFEIGGAERNTLKLLSFLDRHSFSPSLVLAQKKGGFLERIPADVPIAGLQSFGYLGTLLALRRYLLKNRPDVLVSAFPHFNVICLLARQLAGVATKVVITEHTPFSLLAITARNFFNKFVTIFFLPLAMKMYYPKAGAVICVSQGVANDITKLTAVKNISVIYNPIVDGELRQLAEQSIGHPWFGGAIPVLIAVGRLAKAKDYPTLFKALKIILAKQPVRLLILGEGPEENTLKKMVAGMGLSEHIDFLGFCANPYAYMKKSSVFVLSSIQEGFGNAIVEAMACDTPVVSTDCPSGPREIIENGKNGILVPVADTAMLSKAIVSVLEDGVLRASLIKEGALRTQYFSVQKSVTMYENIFKKVMQ